MKYQIQIRSKEDDSIFIKGPWTSKEEALESSDTLNKYLKDYCYSVMASEDGTIYESDCWSKANLVLMGLG
jgi:hypothetical protein